MTLTLEAPSVIEQPEVRLFAEPPEAVEAAELLDAVELEIATEPPAEPAAENDPVTEGKEEATADQASEPEATSDETEATSDETPTPPALKPQQSAYEIRRRQYLREKDILQEQISALMIEQAKLREQIKKCKKEAEVYCEQLSELIEAWENASPEDEFPVSVLASGCGIQSADRTATEQPQSEPASQQDGSDGSDGPGGEPRSGNAEPDAEPDAEQYESVLRSVSLESLGVGGKLLEKLVDEGITSIWAWEDLRKEIGLGRAEWPKGVGEKKRDDINARIGDWIAKNSHRWTPRGTVEAVNDAVEQRQDAERAAEVAESQPPVVAPAAVGIDDL